MVCKVAIAKSIESFSFIVNNECITIFSLYRRLSLRKTKDSESKTLKIHFISLSKMRSMFLLCEGDMIAGKQMFNSMRMSSSIFKQRAWRFYSLFVSFILILKRFYVCLSMQLATWFCSDIHPMTLYLAPRTYFINIFIFLFEKLLTSYIQA